MSPASMAAAVFPNTRSLVSPKYLRPSMRLTITCEQPNALIIEPETTGKGSTKILCADLYPGSLKIDENRFGTAVPSENA